MKSYKINENTELKTLDDNMHCLKYCNEKGYEVALPFFTKRDLLTLYYAIQEIITGEHIELPKER